MGDSDLEAVLVRKEGAVSQLVLNRPARLNAIDAEVAAGILAGLKTVQSDPSCRCLTITGAGRGFCAGQSLTPDESGESLPADIARLIQSRYTPIIAQIRALDVPVIAEVNGVAAGAGFALALAADLRLASESAWFSCAFAGIGLVPDSGTSFFLTRYLGSSRTFELAATGRRVSASEAATLGLVAEVYPEDTFVASCRDFASRLAAGPTRAFALTKKLINLALVNTLADQFAAEAAYQQQASETRDFKEGLLAFRERRPAQFEGH